MSHSSSRLPPLPWPPPKVAVVGIGGVGGVLAASLHAAGRCSLTLVSRGWGLDRLRSSGLEVMTHEGRSYRAVPPLDGTASCGTVVADAEELERGGGDDDADADAAAGGRALRQDYVLVCTKSYQLPSTLGALLRLVGPDTAVVPCVNGVPWWFHPPGLQSVDPDGAMAASVDPRSVLGTVGMVSGNVTGRYDRWESRWPSDRNVLTIGEPFGNADSTNGRAGRLATLFDDERVKVRVEISDDIRSRIFDKVVLNCSLNVAGAITGLDCGETVERGSASKRMVRALAGEARAVGAELRPAVGLGLDADGICDIFTGQYGLQTSMLRDVLAGRETEVDSMVGAVVELGEIHGVDTPALRFAYDTIKAIEGKKLER